MLAAAFNALMLFAIAIYVLVEGIQRLRNPESVQSTGMLVVAIVGLIVNFVSMRLLMAGKDQSLNVKGAYLEVWADMLGSVGVIAGRSEEHTSELQSLMRISYAVFCLKKKKLNIHK